MRSFLSSLLILAVLAGLWVQRIPGRCQCETAAVPAAHAAHDHDDDHHALTARCEIDPECPCTPDCPPDEHRHHKPDCTQSAPCFVMERNHHGLIPPTAYTLVADHGHSLPPDGPVLPLDKPPLVA